MTSKDNHLPNAVSGYDLLKDCLWGPLTEIIDKSLSFVFSATSPSLFHRNYRVAKDFISLLRDLYYGQDYLDRYLDSRFNL